MAQFVFVNNFNTDLAAAITSSQTTITVTSVTGLPTLEAGQIVPLTLLDAATQSVYEIVYVTGISGTTLTVTRNEEGTIANAYAAGDLASCNPTADSVPPVRSSLSYTASQTIPTGNDIILYPGVMAANVVLTLPATGMPIAGRIRVYGSDTAYTTTVNLTNTTGSPFILLPDGSQNYSYILPANQGQNFIDLFWSGYNWTAFNGGIMSIPNANAPNQPVAQGQVVNLPPFGAENTVNPGTGVSVTTGSFLAPSSGFLLVSVNVGASPGPISALSVSASLSGLVPVFLGATGGVGVGSSYLPMTKGQSTTLSASMSSGASGANYLNVQGVFFPTP